MADDMNILDYKPPMAEDLRHAYNRATKDVPHCCPVERDDFSSVLVEAGAEGGQELSERFILVAKASSGMAGFVDAGLVEGRRETDVHGSIRFLWYEPGNRIVGQRLLGEAERRLLRLGVPRIKAFEQGFRYPFYHLRHAYLSHRLGHVQALLGMNGYLRSAGEIFMDWPDFYPLPLRPIEVEPSISVELAEGRGRLPGITLRATLGGEEVGVCESLSCGEFSRSELVQDWLFTTGLNVKPEYQGRGLGKYLLGRALEEAHSLGYRNASISTDWNNHRAFLFYTNYGYYVVDWTYEFTRAFGRSQ